MQRLPIVATCALLVLAIASVVRSGRSPDERPSSTEVSRQAPGVVLLCLDTLRADALALDSDRPVRMPRLEAFARQGVAFADAVSAAAWTGPSMTSLLTGLDPSHTGVVGLPERIGHLGPSVKTLAEHMKEAGRHVCAITTAAWLNPATSALRGTQIGAVGLDADPEGVLRGWNSRRPAGVPFFLFLHSLGAHDPYLDKGSEPSVTSAGMVDADHARALARAIERGETKLSDADLRWAAEICLRSAATRARLTAVMGRSASDTLWGLVQSWLDDGAERDPRLSEMATRLRAAYVEGLAHLDRLFGRVLDGLDGLGLPEGTVVIVVGDHGESFAEHGTLMHGRRLFDELVRVPLLVRAPGRMGAPRVIHGDVGLVDVVPTILELVDRPVPDGLDGIGLVAATAAPSGLPERAMHAFEERRRFDGGVERIELLESIRTTRAKAILVRDAKSHRVVAADVFDLQVDPLEQHPIPLDAINRLCEFGDAFARALRDLGFSVPCLGVSALPTPGVSGG